MSRHAFAWVALLSAVHASGPAGTAHLELPEATVQASRKARTPDHLPQKVEILSRRDMALTPADDLTDQLKKSLPVDVIQYPGLLSGVGLRGFRPQFSGLNQRTLLLVDGRPAGATNAAALDLLPMERIEVVRGPFSALYGPQAMGGVINLVPRRSRGRVVTEARAATGSFGRFQGAVLSGGNLSERVSFDLAVQATTLTRDMRIGREHTLRNLGITGDDRATLKPAGAPEVKVDDRGDGQLRPHTKHEEQGGALRLGWDLGGTWTLDTRAELHDAPNVESPGDIHHPADLPGRKSYERYGGDVRLQGRVRGHDLALNAWRSREYQEQHQVAGNYKIAETTLDFLGVGLRDGYALGTHLVTVGAEYQVRGSAGRSWDDAAAPRAPSRPDHSITDAALYAEACLSFLDERLIGTFGARYDRIAFEVLRTDLLAGYQPGREEHDVISPSVGLLYRFDAGFRLRSNAGRGFVTPDAFQVAGHSRAFQGSGRLAITRGNADLRPERNLTVDGGVSYENPARGLSLDLTYFHTEVEDRIASRTVRRPSLPLEVVDGDTVASLTTYVNANASRMRGLEGRASGDLGAWLGWSRSFRLFANSTWMLEAVDETRVPSRDGLRDSLVQEADIKNVGTANAVFGLEYDDRRFLSGRLAGRYLGKRLDTDFNDPRLPDIEYPRFLLFDVALRMRLGSQNALSLAVGNLLNENYYEKRGFNLPGRDYRVGYSRTF